jgi:hypothetical protein
MRSAATQGCRNRGTIIPSDFGRSVKPILIRGADYAHKITTHPLVFSDLPTALQLKLAFHLKVFSMVDRTSLAKFDRVSSRSLVHRVYWRKTNCPI